MSVMVTKTTRVLIVYSTVCSVIDQRRQQSFASLAFVGGIHRWLVNFPHKGPVTQKLLPFDVVIMMQFFSSINEKLICWFSWPRFKQRCNHARSRTTFRVNHVNSLAPGKCSWNVKLAYSNFQTQIKDRYLEYFVWNWHQVNATRPQRLLVNIASGNGLVPSGIKPLSEPTLTQIYITICHHNDTMSYR